MDAQQALADLTEISSQIRAAVIFDETAKVAASTLGDDERASELARAARDLLAAADAVRPADGAQLTQLEAATTEGSVFVVRDGKTRIAATTTAEPTVGLVFYDLKSALRNIEAKPERKPAARKKPSADAATAKKPAAKKPAAKKPAAKKPATPRKKTDAS